MWPGRGGCEGVAIWEVEAEGGDVDVGIDDGDGNETLFVKYTECALTSVLRYQQMEYSYTSAMLQPVLAKVYHSITPLLFKC